MGFKTTLFPFYLSSENLKHSLDQEPMNLFGKGLYRKYFQLCLVTDKTSVAVPK